MVSTVKNIPVTHSQPSPLSRVMRVALAVTFGFLVEPSQGYISLQAVPPNRQVEFLKEMTVDFTDHVEIGHMSKDDVSRAPELMYAWSHTPEKSTDKALALESLIKRLVDEKSAGNVFVSDLTVNDYNCLLEGWARSGAGEAAAERCEMILSQMEQEGGLVKPNLQSFKTVLMAWRQAEVHHSAYRSQRVLEGLVRRYQENPRENRSLLPDSDCFDIVLQTWSRSGHVKAPELAEGILAAMERLYESTVRRSVKPRTTSFNAVLAAWARSKDPKAADRASDLLGFMELLEEHGDKTVAPDNASYCTVMGALARHKGDPVVVALKSERLLRCVEDRFRREQSDIVPDTILFNTAMGFWAKTYVAGSHYKARAILDRQNRLFKSGCEKCRPDVFGYTSVIASACSETRSNEKRAKAFNVAFSTFRQMEQDGVRPNHVTYGNMLKACARLLPPASPARRKWARRIFQECRDAGYVGDMVLSRLREAAPTQYKDILGGHKKKSLPHSWTRNLPQTKNERKQRLSRGRMVEV